MLWPVPLGGADAAARDRRGVASRWRRDARLAGDDKQTRLVIDLTHKIDVRAFTIADPYRVVIDIPQVNFQFPPRTGEHSRGMSRRSASAW